MRLLNVEDIVGCKKIQVQRFSDNRGYFCEHFNAGSFGKILPEVKFVQDNYSSSNQNVLRGLHFQHPSSQGKLLGVITGKIYDVIVDLRKSSPTFGCWASILMEEESDFLLWIPEGLAHGFLTLGHKNIVFYKTTRFWKKEEEYALMWNDPSLGIKWPCDSEPMISEKDQQGVSFADAPYFK